MYIVIYDKITKVIYNVIDKNTPYLVAVGYSDNCMQSITNTRPEGRIWQG